MTRLIDADALSEKLCETTIFIKDGEVFQRMINDAPSADAVEVVRCEDCKWHLNGHLCKQLSHHYGSIETPPSFYCGLGERMVKHEGVNSLHER